MPFLYYVPIINWIISKGRCFNCKAKVPLIHLFVEASTILLYCFAYFKYTLSNDFILLVFSIVSLSIIILAIELQKFRIPKDILYVFLILCILLGDTKTFDSYANLLFLLCGGIINVVIFNKIYLFVLKRGIRFDYAYIVIAITMATGFVYSLIWILLSCLLSFIFREMDKGKGVSPVIPLVAAFVLDVII